MSLHPSIDLDARQAAVLRAIIGEHTLTGEPVGSQTAARAARVQLSAASIRSVMAELEGLGLLWQPHTSAGRVPTDLAYRVFVDRLMHRPRVNAAQAQLIERALSGSQGEVAALLGAVSRQLSRFSNQVGLVLAPTLRRIIIDHLEFVRLDGRRILAILVGRSGVVHNRVLHVERSPDQQELDRCGRYLSGEFGHRTLRQMRKLLQQKMSEERALCDRLLSQRLELGRQAVEVRGQESEVLVEGTANLLDTPESADRDKLKAMLRTLEQKETLIGLLSQVLDGEGVQVVIGKENPATGPADLSLVASSYGTDEQALGTLGIVGPMRMEYARAIALVGFLGDLLTRVLSERGN